MAALLEAALAAQRARDFKRAREILRAVMVVQGDKVDHFVVEQLALATYKSEDLEPSVALLDAKNILRPFEPDTSTDPEMLEIWATIHQRLFELRDAPSPHVQPHLILPSPPSREASCSRRSPAAALIWPTC
jgi:hypothetical protein